MSHGIAAARALQPILLNEAADPGARLTPHKQRMGRAIERLGRLRLKCSFHQESPAHAQLPCFQIAHQEPSLLIYIYVYLCFFLLLRAHLFVFAPFSETSGGVGTIRPLGSRCRRFGRDPCSVSPVARLLNFLALGTLKANPRVSATSPGIGFLHPLSPRTYVRFGCKPGFSARRGCSTRFFAYFCTEHHATILPPSSSPPP